MGWNWNTPTNTSTASCRRQNHYEPERGQQAVMTRSLSLSPRYSILIWRGTDWILLQVPPRGKPKYGQKHGQDYGALMGDAFDVRHTPLLSPPMPSRPNNVCGWRDTYSLGWELARRPVPQPHWPPTGSVQPYPTSGDKSRHVSGQRFPWIWIIAGEGGMVPFVVTETARIPLTVPLDSVFDRNPGV